MVDPSTEHQFTHRYLTEDLASTSSDLCLVRTVAASGSRSVSKSMAALSAFRLSVRDRSARSGAFAT
jgi:hypothetical protein